ncbi:hypothetical protein ADUPG1_008293 [Aduncisulcus paluster]|uniref:Uncharacterized protein n=1 Tax=Aduncisulcus paluster TaxID=2918883 RepID=A0ABQ5KSR8_9EUKA|nr:hypothetical protein ADUPG1_008293 [Aduncisulcus paluster]
MKYPATISLENSAVQIIEPVFIYDGDRNCCPIPKDAPNVKSPNFPKIKASNATKKKADKEHDQSSEAQDLMKGKVHVGQFTNLSIPFSSCSPVKGAYICLDEWMLPPSYLTFTLSSSEGEKISKKYEFSTEFVDDCWFFLPIDLSDVILCEIAGKGREEECFDIPSLVFICREETPEEIKTREAKEKLWSKSPVVKAKFVKKGDRKSRGRHSSPIPPDDPSIIAPSYSSVKGKDNSYCKESKDYDQSVQARKMLKGEDCVVLSHLSIPFPSPSPIQGAYISIHKNLSSPFLLSTFFLSDGTKIFKKYEFTRPKTDFEWHFIPIELTDVVLCEIEGKGRWREKNSRWFYISSLFFTISDEIIAAERLSLIPWDLYNTKDEL